MQDAANKHSPARQPARTAEIPLMIEPLEALMSRKVASIGDSGRAVTQMKFFSFKRRSPEPRVQMSHENTCPSAICPLERPWRQARDIGARHSGVAREVRPPGDPPSRRHLARSATCAGESRSALSDSAVFLQLHDLDRAAPRFVGIGLRVLAARMREIEQPRAIATHDHVRVCAFHLVVRALARRFEQVASLACPAEAVVGSIDRQSVPHVGDQPPLVAPAECLRPFAGLVA